MHRREFVVGSGTAIAVAIAGCATVTGSRRLSLHPFDPDHVAYRVADLTADQEAALETIRDGGADVTYGYHRFNNPGEKGYLQLEHGFYRLTTEETGDRLVPRDILFAEPDDSEVAAANAVPAAEVYDEADRRRIVQAIEPATEWEHIYSDHYVFRNVDPDESDLLYEPAYPFVELETDSPLGSVRVFRLQTVAGTISETEYTTMIDPVADTADELARHLDEEGLVHSLDEAALSADQREVLETAIENGSYAEPQSLADDGVDPFEGVPLAPKHDPLTERPYRLIRYEDGYYVWSVTYTNGDI